MILDLEPEDILFDASVGAEMRENVDDRGVAVLLAVARERARQELLVREGRFTFTCADADGLTPAEKYVVLGEEFGEVGRCVLTLPDQPRAHDTRSSVEQLRSELVHVAAVAVAWAESLTE